MLGPELVPTSQVSSWLSSIMHLSGAQSPGKYRTWLLKAAKSILISNENKAESTQRALHKVFLIFLLWYSRYVFWSMLLVPRRRSLAQVKNVALRPLFSYEIDANVWWSALSICQAGQHRRRRGEHHGGATAIPAPGRGAVPSLGAGPGGLRGQWA